MGSPSKGYISNSAVEVAGDSLSIADEIANKQAKQIEDSDKDGRMWAINGNNYFPCSKAIKSLEPGQYVIRHNESGIYFYKKIVNVDELVKLPDNNSEKVLASIKHFWDNENAFRSFGFLWKRGILLCGPPGGGKTSTVQQLSKLIIDKGGISIYGSNPALDAEGLTLLRHIEPTRPIIVILEDIDAIIRHHEAEMLALLDGEHQTDNVVFVATTNYPELLDKRFTNRPSRFDEIVIIDMPNAECRKTYITAKNTRLTKKDKTTKAELQEWINLTDRFSIAHLKELIISVECFGDTVQFAAKRLRKMIEHEVNSDKFGGKDTVGFKVNDNEYDNQDIHEKVGVEAASDNG